VGRRQALKDTAMGHLLFLVLHLGLLLFLPIALILTIPLHLIYGAVSSKRPAPGAPSHSTHVRCPDCRELVRRDATVCKHCSCKLVPQPAQRAALWRLLDPD